MLSILEASKCLQKVIDTTNINDLGLGSYDELDRDRIVNAMCKKLFEALDDRLKEEQYRCGQSSRNFSTDVLRKANAWVSSIDFPSR